MSQHNKPLRSWEFVHYAINSIIKEEVQHVLLTVWFAANTRNGKRRLSVITAHRHTTHSIPLTSAAAPHPHTAHTLVSCTSHMQRYLEAPEGPIALAALNGQGGRGLFFRVDWLHNQMLFCILRAQLIPGPMRDRDVCAPRE